MGAGPTMQVIQAPSVSRLATGRIILVVLVITWAMPITFGGLDIGDGITAKESGSTATTSREDTELCGGLASFVSSGEKRGFGVLLRSAAIIFRRSAEAASSERDGNAPLSLNTLVRNARFCGN
jgi:hypothetical protein